MNDETNNNTTKTKNETKTMDDKREKPKDKPEDKPKDKPKDKTKEKNTTDINSTTSTTTTTTTTSVSSSTSIFSNIKNLSLNTIKLFYTFFAVNIINLSNYFLNELKKRLDYFVPNEKNLKDGVNENKVLIDEINEILKSPEFKQKWDETTENIVDLLKQFLDKLDVTLGDQVKDVLERFQHIATTSISRTIASVGESALSAICVIPGANIVCESIDVGSILVQTAGDSIKVFTSLLISFEKMTSAFATIFGDTAVPFSNSIKKVIDLKNFISSSLGNATNAPKKIIQGANKYVKEAQQTLEGQETQTGGYKKQTIHKLVQNFKNKKRIQKQKRNQKRIQKQNQQRNQKRNNTKERKHNTKSKTKDKHKKRKKQTHMKNKHMKNKHIKNIQHTRDTKKKKQLKHKNKTFRYKKHD